MEGAPAPVYQVSIMAEDPPVPSLRVHHLAVVVRDLDRAEAFYGAVLGLRPLRRWTDGEGAPRSIWFELGAGAFLAVELAPASTEGEPLLRERLGPTTPATPPPPAPGWHCVALSIDRDARSAWRARLTAAGHPVERESDYSFYVRDPEGNLVALSHWPEPRIA